MAALLSNIFADETNPFGPQTVMIWFTELSVANIKAVDKSGTSDPYVKVFTAPDQLGFALKKQSKTLNAKWGRDSDLYYLLADLDTGLNVYIEVWDHNRIQKDVFLGCANFHIDIVNIDPFETEFESGEIKLKGRNDSDLDITGIVSFKYDSPLEELSSGAIGFKGRQLPLVEGLDLEKPVSFLISQIKEQYSIVVEEIYFYQDLLEDKDALLIDCGVTKSNACFRVKGDRKTTE